MTHKNLPPNWSWIKLGDVVKFIRGVSFSKDAKSLSYSKGKIACLRTANVQKEVDWDDLWFIDEKIVKRDEQFVNVGDILISSANSLELLGKVSLIKQIPFKSTLGTFIVNIRVPENLNNKFVYYYLTSREFTDNVHKNASTTTNISNISVGKLEQIPIRIPPLPEQKKIVEKIEELFSGLDSGVASLKKAKVQIRLYRQSVLSAAFSGLLHQDSSDYKINRIKEKNKSGKSTNPENPNLANPQIKTNPGSDNLPDGWKWVKLGEISDKIQYGYTESASSEPIGPKFLRITDIQDGNVIWNEVPYCKISDEVKNKYQLKDGDIVFARTGATVGKSFLILGKIPESVFASYLIRIRLSDNINKKFIYFFFQSNNYWQQITEGQVGIGQPNVNGTKLSQLIVPMCSIEEQSQIVSEIEKRFSEADNLEKAIDESLAKSETLRQSILKQAFEGRLV